MAQIVITEAPGGAGEAYQCPFCSRMYSTRFEENGEFVPDRVADPPKTCRRCGSPMDLEAAKKFEDEQAVKAAAAPTSAGRPRRTIQHNPA